MSNLNKIKQIELKNEIEKRKLELMKKEMQINKLENKIVEERQLLEINKNEYNIMNNKYLDLKFEYKEKVKENKELFNEYQGNLKEIELLKQKEFKLMKIIYMIREQGVDINKILEDVINYNENN